MSSIEEKEKISQTIKARKHKEEFVRNQKIEREYAKALMSDDAFKQASTIDDSTDILAMASTITPIEALKQLRNKSKLGSTFIHKDFDKFFKLQPGMLIAVLGYTGGGKTTSGANIAATLIECDKKIAIISNEEPARKYITEITCLLAGQNSYFMQDTRDRDQIGKYTSAANALKQESLRLYDSECTNGATQNATSILKSIEKLNSLDIDNLPDIVIVDYLQNIMTSGTGASMNAGDHYSMLDSFCANLKNLANTLKFSVIVMAQMHSDDKRKGEAADAKVIMGSSILRNSMKVVEVRSDKETHSTEFRISKNRDGNGLGKVSLTWKNGRYVTKDETYEKTVALKNIANNIPDKYADIEAIDDKS